MGQPEIKHTHGRVLLGTAVWLVSVFALLTPARGESVARPPWRGHLALASRGHPGLVAMGRDAVPVSPEEPGDSRRVPPPRGAGDAPAMKEQGRDALATSGVPQEPVIINGESLPPAVTVERRGRLLVLTYGSKSGGGALMSHVNPRSEPPGFVVYQGQWPIASGKFEYG